MANNLNHSIRRFLMDVEMDDKDKAFDMQTELARIYHAKLESITERLFDEYQVPGHIFRIKELELDLGDISKAYLEDEVVTKYEAALKEALIRLKADATYKLSYLDRNAELIPLTPIKRDVVRYFLIKGRMLSTAANFPGKIHNLFEELVSDAPEEALQMLLDLIDRFPEAIRRFVEQFPRPSINRAFRLLSPSYHDYVQEEIQSLAAAIHQQRPDVPIERIIADLRQSSIEFLGKSQRQIFSKVRYLRAVRRKMERNLNENLFDAFPAEAVPDQERVAQNLEEAYSEQLQTVIAFLQGDAARLPSTAELQGAWDTLVRDNIQGLRQVLTPQLPRVKPIFDLAAALESDRIHSFVLQLRPAVAQELIRVIVRLISQHSQYLQGQSADKAFRDLVYAHLLRYSLEAAPNKQNPTSLAVYLKRVLSRTPGIPTELMEDWDERIKRPQDPKYEASPEEAAAAEEAKRKAAEKAEAEREKAAAEKAEREKAEKEAAERGDEVPEELEQKTKEEEAAEKARKEQAAKEAREKEAQEAKEKKAREAKEEQKEKEAAELTEEELAEREAEEKRIAAEEEEAKKEAEKAGEEQEEGEESWEPLETDSEKAWEEKRAEEEKAKREQALADAEELLRKAEAEEAAAEKEKKASEEQDAAEEVKEKEAELIDLEQIQEAMEADQDPEQSQIDFVLYLIKTGEQPWWAKNLKDPDPIAILAKLTSNQQFVQAFQKMVADLATEERPQTVMNLLRNFGEAGVSAFLEKALPNIYGFLATVAMALGYYSDGKHPIPQNIEFRTRYEWKWYYILRFYFDYMDQIPSPQEFLHYLVQMIAAGTPQSEMEVLTKLRIIAFKANKRGEQRFLPMVTLLPKNAEDFAPLDERGKPSVELETNIYAEAELERLKKEREEKAAAEAEAKAKAALEEEALDAEGEKTEAEIVAEKEAEEAEKQTAEAKEQAEKKAEQEAEEAVEKESLLKGEEESEKEQAKAEEPVSDQEEKEAEAKEDALRSVEEEEAEQEKRQKEAEQATEAEIDEERADREEVKFEREEGEQQKEDRQEFGEEEAPEDAEAKKESERSEEEKAEAEKTEAEKTEAEKTEAEAERALEGESEEKAERVGEEQAEEAEEKTQEAKTEEERAPEVDEEARREAQREAMADEMADAIAEMEEDEEELEEAQERKSAETERETERPGVDDGDEPLTEEAEELEDPKLRNEVIEYFLLQGTLPNRYDTLSESQVMELLLDFAREMPRRLVKIIKENAHSPVARMRWASFSEEVTEYMLLLLLPDLQRRHFHAYLVLLRQVFSQPGAPVPVSALTAHAFEYFAEATATDYRMDEYVRSLLKKIDRDSPFSAVWTIEWIMQVLAGKSSPIGLSFREVLIAIRPEYEPLKDTEEEISEDTELIPEEEAEKRKVPEPEPEEDPTIFINNAGLAVVFALLPSIFKSMEFLNEKGDFINDAVRERAIHFLAYLTHQQEKTPEEELVLNKILIGWPIDRSIMKNVPLSDAEKQVAEEVIAEIVEKWPGMEGTNNMSFRKSWFQRDGRLEPDSTETWVLRVDQRGFDMLLDKLPWRYSKFEAPWAKDTIRVEWR